MSKINQKFQKPRKNKQNYRKNVKNGKKPRENLRKYLKIVKNVEKC